MNKVVISMSGGLDSTCLALRELAKGREVRAYAFDYGQGHSIELHKLQLNIQFLQRKNLPISLQVINLRDVFSDSQSSLCGNGEIPKGHYEDSNMKSTVVENRNVIFSAIIYGKALSWAKQTDSKVRITLGIHAGDHCFTENMKLLTPKGYKTIKELNIGDEIYSVNNENKIEKDIVVNAFKTATVDKVLNINTTTGNLSVTDDHKVYRIKFSDFDNSKGYDKQIELVKACELNIGDILLSSYNLHEDNSIINDEFIDLSQFNDGNFIVDDEYIYIKKNNPCKRFIKAKNIIELMAWYITEGWTNRSMNPAASKYLSSFSQSLWMNMENCDNIQNMLTDGEIPVRYNYSKKIENGYPKEITYTFSGIISSMLQTSGCNAQEKNIPQWLMNFLINNPGYIEDFVLTMIEGDGHYNKLSGIYQYTSISKKLINDLGFLIKKLGYSVKVSQNKNCYILTFGSKNRKNGLIKFGDLAQTKITNITIDDSVQDVYDITVEKNHNFFVGDNANILTHNCIYPDCTPESQAMARELFRISNWGSEDVDYVTPFVNSTKGEVLEAGVMSMKKMGFSDEDITYVLDHTHTCYSPDDQGRSCGKCGSCTERLEAFEYVGMKDPVRYQE